MMFDKDNTNFNGECLCKSCIFGLDIPFIKYKETNFICCRDREEHSNVGVCKDYEREINNVKQ